MTSNAVANVVMISMRLNNVWFQADEGKKQKIPCTNNYGHGLW